MAKVRQCAQSPVQPEYSLCGDAFDIADTEAGEEPYIIATPGKFVTCDVCKAAIREIHERYTKGGFARF